MIELGNEVRDKVTGFQGIATARVQYMNGCTQYCVKPPAGDDGKMPSGEYIDDQQLEVVGIGVAYRPTETGGPMADTPSDSYAG